MELYQKVTSILFLVTLIHVKSDVIFDDYAGPYSFVKNYIGFEDCPAKTLGRSCANLTHQRRKLPNSDNWIYNVSATINVYMKETTTFRIVATTRGSSGRYQSLADLTMASCDWAELVRPLVEEFVNHAGYKYDCYAVIPGKYSITNFVFDHKRFYMFPQVPIAPYGFYRVEFRASEKNNPNCYCCRIYVKVVPDAKAIRQLQHNRTAQRIFT